MAQVLEPSELLSPKIRLSSKSISASKATCPLTHALVLAGGLRIRWCDPIAEVFGVADHSRSVSEILALVLAAALAVWWRSPFADRWLLFTPALSSSPTQEERHFAAS